MPSSLGGPEATERVLRQQACWQLWNAPSWNIRLPHMSYLSLEHTQLPIRASLGKVAVVGAGSTLPSVLTCVHNKEGPRQAAAVVGWQIMPQIQRHAVL